MEKEELFKNWGVALTGGIGSGKSFVASYLRENGCPVFDADILAREVCKKGQKAYQKILSTFGASILRKEDEEINRLLLGKQIFQNPEQRKILESIVHPAIQEKLLDDLHKERLFKDPRLWFYEAALIFENKKESLFLETWLIYCKPETQQKRVEARNKAYSEGLIEKIMASQNSLEEKLQKASFSINTEESKKDVLKRVQKHLEELQLKKNSF